ncbi:hypothetical protein V496_00031 [Pseudogymnoascus sp. VKM F-4515 (FW-2607)]|nr:hypothetical protein V496_00031 [Pseudogymnoascus sp. VKM F-4515 (FW-2607)]
MRLEILSEQQKQQRLYILSQLQNEPASIHLQDYFKRLEVGSPTWDIDTFIAGAKCLANLSGSERDKYYCNPLKGLHYPNSFTKLWNQKHPQLPLTLLDVDIRRPCPRTWFNGDKNGRLVLIYHGDAPLSQGLNELIEGPSTLVCGIWCQLLMWMMIRYLIGDELFDRSFKFDKAPFTLTEIWETPMNDASTAGNLLHDFYDDPRYTTTDPSELERRIQTRTFFNHATYRATVLALFRWELAVRYNGLVFAHKVETSDD